MIYIDPGEGAVPLHGVRAEATFDPDYGPLWVILGVTGVVFIVMLLVRLQENAMWKELLRHAMELGWTEVPREQVPKEIEHLVEWRRPWRILRGPAGAPSAGGPLWLVWHQWTTSRGGGRGARSHTTHNVTRLLGGRPVDWPDLAVIRRTALGAKLMPVNGPGTGDGEFDRRFIVRTEEPTDEPVVLTPDLRTALLREEIVPFDVRAGIATTVVRAAPGVDIFDEQVPRMTRILELLSTARPD